MNKEIDCIKEPNIIIYKSGEKEIIDTDRFHKLWIEWCCGKSSYKYDRSKN